eukprot:15460058-Alexandrium_andersonii.AAC.1
MKSAPPFKVDGRIDCGAEVLNALKVSEQVFGLAPTVRSYVRSDTDQPLKLADHLLALVKFLGGVPVVGEGNLQAPME